MKVESQKIKNIQQIPFYPFSFSRAMLWFLIPTVENTFTSSGTTGLTTSNIVTDTSIYTESYQKDFLSFMET
jgi:hypothetical protein